MEPRLRDLLNECRDPNETKGDYTHVTLSDGRHWMMRPSGMVSFVLGYCSLVETNISSDLCLAEKAEAIMPVIAEFTFRFHNISQGEAYPDDFLFAAVCCYQRAMEETINISKEGTELICCVLESAATWEEYTDHSRTEVHHVTRLRLQFPYCRINVAFQQKTLLPLAIRYLRECNAKAKMTNEPIGDWNQILNPRIVTDPLLMYGSEREAGRPKMILERIFSRIAFESLEDEELIVAEQELTNIFRPEHHRYVQQNLMKPELFVNNDKDTTFWLPLLLSVGYYQGLSTEKENIKHSVSSQSIIVNERDAHSTNIEEMNMAASLVVMIRQERLQKSNFWLDIGRIMFNVTKGSMQGLDLWVKITQKVWMNDPKKSATLIDEAQAIYSSFNTSNLSVKTLAWYAREDSPDHYAEWHKRWCLENMEKALSGLHNDVGKAFYSIFWLDFVCGSMKGKGRWFQFVNHHWIETEEGVSLRQAMSEGFLKRFEQMRTLISRKISETEDESIKATGEANMKKITGLISKLKSQPYKNNIMAELKEHFHHARFLELMDADPNIFGIYNGVIELTETEAVVRSGKPEDYVSKYAMAPYYANYSWKHPLVIELMKWLGQVYTDKDLLHHFLKFSSSCLKGRNSDKLFPIWTGEGDNSKSMEVKLFEATFGAYCIKFPISLITAKKMNSSGPTPELARAKSARVAFLEEPSRNDKLEGGILKSLSGGDSFFARMLQENGGDVQAMFKIILMCNQPPVIPDADKAIKNRTRLFPHLSTWVDNAPADEAEQYKLRLFKKNPFFEKRITALAPAFLWVLVQYFPIYMKEGLIDPPIIKQVTQEYWQNNDEYAAFTTDCIQQALDVNGQVDVNAVLSLNDIYKEFKIWYTEVFPKLATPDRSKVRDELSMRWGKPRGGFWSGIRLATTVANVDTRSLLKGR